mgnify:CR=1 FL=1
MGCNRKINTQLVTGVPTLAITWPQSALGEEDLLAEAAQVYGIVGLPIQKSEEDIHVPRHAKLLDHR